MRWNGKNFRAPGKKISVYPKPQNDIRELLKPLGEKTWKGNVWVPILNQPLNIQKEAEAPVVSPSPTPSVTPSPSSTPPPPSPSMTPTPTPSPSAGPAFDPDAAAYLSAVIAQGGTVDATISAATNTMFTDLKSAGLYSKLYSFYPFVGASANSHSLNAKTPYTHSIRWLGSNISHNISGATMPGAAGGGGYGRFTGFSTSDITTSNGDVHASLYVFTVGAASDGGYDLCSSDLNNAEQNYIIVKFNKAATSYYDWFGSYTKSTTSGVAEGYWFLTRDAANTQSELYKNGSVLATGAQTIHYTTTDWFLGTEVANGLAANGKNSKGYNFVTFGNKLDSTEQGTLSTIINTFQTTLGRNTY